MTLDRDAARDVLINAYGGDPAPHQTIDRNALRLVIRDALDEGIDDENAFADAVLALPRPVDGVTLTREEAQQCAAALYTEDSIWGLDPKNKALADRLAVAQ